MANTPGSDNPFPSLLFAEHIDPANPGAGTQRLFVDTDHLLKLRDSAGTVTLIATGSAGMTNPMTTKGDIILGDTSGVPSRLAAGTLGYVLTAAGAGAFPAWAAAAGGSATPPDEAETFLSADVTCTNIYTTEVYSHTSLALTPAAGDWEITAEFAVTCSGTSAVAAIGIIATGGSLASNVLTGHTVQRDTLEYNSANNGGGTVKCVVTKRLTLNGSTVVRAAIGAGAGSSTCVIKTTNAQGGATAAANKATRLSAQRVTAI